MDTIIYLYRKRELQEPAIDTVQMRDYLLVRVGMNVGESQWFSHRAFPPKVLADEPGEKLSLWQRWQARKEKAAARRRYRRQELEFQEKVFAVRLEMRVFAAELGRLVDPMDDCYCVYGDTVRKYLVLSEDGQSDRGGDSMPGQDSLSEVPRSSRWLAGLWQQCWNWPEFDAYFQPKWAEALLENARLHHFVVLGSAPCVPFVIQRCARRMKSLRWLLPASDCTDAIQDFVEDFYVEYGLAVALQPLEGKRVFAHLLLETATPVCILDFTGEPRIPAGGVSGGSIWLDFCSVEEKEMRISGRGEGVFYISLKEIWKRAGKP